MLRSFIANLNNRNLYLFLLCGQFLDLINVMVVGEMIRKGLIYISPVLYGLIQFLIIFILNGIALIFVRKFVKSTPLFIAFVLAVVFSILCMMIAEMGYGVSAESIKILRMSGVGFQIFSLSFIVVVAVKDIFLEKHDLSYSLAGAASIFCMIGTIFGVIYFFFETWSPGMIAVNGNMNVFLTYSFCTLSGQDPSVEVDSVIKNISIFESIFANLYTVMIVGRLLSK